MSECRRKAFGRRVGAFALRVFACLLPLLVFLAGVRFGGFDGRVEWQMPAVAVVVVDRDGSLCASRRGEPAGSRLLSPAASVESGQSTLGTTGLYQSPSISEAY